MKKKLYAVVLSSVALFIASCGTSEDVAYKDTEAYQKALDQANVSVSENSADSSNTMSVETGSSYDGSSIFEDDKEKEEESDSEENSFDTLSGIELDSVSADDFFATDNENLEAVTQEEAQENANLNYGIKGSSSDDSQAAPPESSSGDSQAVPSESSAPESTSSSVPSDSPDSLPESSGELSIGVNKTVKNSSKYDLEKLAESTTEFRQYPRYSSSVWFSDSVVSIHSKSISYDSLYLFADSFVTVSHSGKKQLIKSFHSSGELLCEVSLLGTVDSVSYAHDTLVVLSSKGSAYRLTCCLSGSSDAWSLDLDKTAGFVSDGAYGFKELPVSFNSKYVVVNGIIYSLPTGKLLKDTKQPNLFATKSGFLLVSGSVNFYDHSLKLVKKLENSSLDSSTIKALMISEYVVLSTEKKTFVFDSEGTILKTVPFATKSIHSLDFDNYSAIACDDFSFAVLKNSIMAFAPEVQRKAYVNASLDLENSSNDYLCYQGDDNSVVLDVSSGVELNVDYAGIFIGDEYLFVYSDTNFYLLNRNNEVILGKEGMAYPLDSSSVLRLKNGKWRIISVDSEEPIQFVKSNSVVSANNGVIQIQENNVYSLYSIVF